MHFENSGHTIGWSLEHPIGQKYAKIVWMKTFGSYRSLQHEFENESLLFSFASLIAF